MHGISKQYCDGLELRIAELQTQLAEEREECARLEKTVDYQSDRLRNRGEENEQLFEALRRIAAVKPKTNSATNVNLIWVMVREAKKALAGEEE